MSTTGGSRLPRVKRQKLILDVAEREFDRRGFHDASMERIARGSGITKALVYQYFDSKEGLYWACIERGRARHGPCTPRRDSACLTPVRHPRLRLGNSRCACRTSLKAASFRT